MDVGGIGGAVEQVALAKNMSRAVVEARALDAWRSRVHECERTRGLDWRCSARWWDLHRRVQGRVRVWTAAMCRSACGVLRRRRRNGCVVYDGRCVWGVGARRRSGAEKRVSRRSGGAARPGGGEGGGVVSEWPGRKLYLGSRRDRVRVA